MSSAAVPILTAYADAVADLVARDTGREPVTPDAGFVSKYAEGLAIRFGRWTEDRATLGQREAVRARHAFTHHAYGRAGVGQLRWVGGEHDGRVAGINDSFVGGKTVRHPDADAVGEIYPA